MKKQLLTSAISAISVVFLSFGQSAEIKKNLEDFKSKDWPTVLEAKINLENMEGEAISSILKLLDEPKIVKLTNTGDLIYPGAEKFYGHGQILDYDIDNIVIRAGWLLEDISFQNFGFSGIHIQEDMLLDFIKKTYPEYYTKNQTTLEKKTAEEVRKTIKSLCINGAKDWWAANQNDWKRLDALMEALASSDEKRVVKGLFYLRNGKTKCTGLDKKYYEFFMAERLMDLARGRIKRISENAKLIVLDYDFDWLEMKATD